MTSRTINSPRNIANWIRHYSAQALENSDVVIASPAQLIKVIASSNKSSALWLMIFDAAAVPGNGAAPSIAPVFLPANGCTVVLDLNEVSGSTAGLSAAGWTGFACSTGIVWAASTTAGTLTVDSTSSVWVDARFVG